MQRKLVIVVDTREQTPWEFGGYPVVRRALKFGDYSLRGMERRCAVERKSAVDLVGSLTNGLARFMREFSCAALSGASLYLLVECSAMEFEATVRRWSPGRIAAGTLAGFMFATKVTPLFCGTRKRAASVALALLRAHT